MKFDSPPGPQRRRQLIVLGVVLLVLAYVGWRQFRPAPAPVAAPPAGRVTAPTVAPAPASNSQARVPSSSPSGRGALPEALKLDALEPVPPEPQSTRNPFRFGQPPAPPPAPVKPAPVTPPPGPPPPPPGPPPIPLRLIGLVTMPDGRRAVLRDNNGVQFQGAEGEIIDGRYRVVKIGLESVMVEYVDGSGRRTLALGQ